MVVEMKEESPVPQRSWMVLVEHTSSNGTRSLVETTFERRLDPSLKDYLREETQDLEVRINDLRKSIQEVPKKKVRGEKKGERRIKNERKALNKELTTALDHKEALEGERYNPRPLVIILKDGETVGWKFPDEADSKWIEFVRDENLKILSELSQNEVFLVHKVFSYRYQIIRQKREWLRNELTTFFDEDIRGDKELGEHVFGWIKKVTNYFEKSVNL